MNFSRQKEHCVLRSGNLCSRKKGYLNNPGGKNRWKKEKPQRMGEKKKE
jgi:hypothetical protein